MTITVTFDPPLPSDSTSTFNTKAFNTLGDLNNWSTEANALATAVNSNAASASTSAGNASSSATAAASSASAAATSASNAATSATNAASSATSAAASLDAFDDRYLGSKTSNPTLDNDGNALLTGALYWNSTASEMRVYTGSTWTTLATTLGTSITANSGAGTSALTITQTGLGNALVVEDSASTDTTPFVIDASGNVIVGHTAKVVSANLVEAHSTAAVNGAPGIASFNWDLNATNAPAFNLYKSQSDTVGTYGIVSSGAVDSIGFWFDDGTQFIRGAQIAAAVDGTPGLNDMPGRLVFSTTADGASTPTERLRIAADGKQTTTGYVQVDNSTSNAAFTITNTGTGNSFVVEDSAGPDSSPFLIDTLGQVISGHTASVLPLSYTGVSRQNNIAAGTWANQEFNQWTATTGIGPSVVFNSSKSGTTGTHAIVANNGDLGLLQFCGSDGAAFIEAARILAEVDGTPGLNDMPGRLTFFTTADGTSTPIERMRIDSAGQVGIGATATATNLRVAKDITGATVAYGVLTNSTIQSDVTSVASTFRSAVSTAAAAFTLTDLAHFYAEQGTIGATSVVTNQYGYYARSTLTGATNNYGFYGAIASGTGKYNFYAAGTAANAFSGDVKIFGAGALGYDTGSGGTVTQGTTSGRLTGVTLNKTNGAITLCSAAGTATWQSFVVTNSTVAATDTIIVNQKSGTDLYILSVTAVSAGSFRISFATTGGTTTEQPVFNFAVIKAVTA